MFFSSSNPLTGSISFYWLNSWLHSLEGLRTWKVQNCRILHLWPYQEQFVQRCPFRVNSSAFKQNQCRAWCNGFHMKLNLCYWRDSRPSVLKVFGLWQSWCEWTQTTHLISCLCFNLINFYRQRRDCRLVCRTHLAERSECTALSLKGVTAHIPWYSNEERSRRQVQQEARWIPCTPVSAPVYFSMAWTLRSFSHLALECISTCLQWPTGSHFPALYTSKYAKIKCAVAAIRVLCHIVNVCGRER